MRKVCFYIGILILIGCKPNSEITETPINWPEFVSKQDLTWDTLKAYFYDGPMTGNGLMGAVIHRMDSKRFDGNTNKILFEVNRTDVTDSNSKNFEGHCWNRFPIGRFELLPVGDIKRLNFRINLWDGLVTGQITTSKGIVRIRHYSHAVKPIMITEIEALEGENPSFDFAPDKWGYMAGGALNDFQEKVIFKKENPKPERTVKDGIIINHQKLLSNRWVEIGWTMKKNGNKIVYYSTLNYSNPAVVAKFDTYQLLKEALAGNYDSLENAHKDWWHKFYQKSYITIPDKTLEKFWWMQQYKIGSTMRKDMQLMDLMGPWFCHTPWAAIWWNWNTQAMYAHLYSSNNTEAGMPLIKILSKYRENLKKNVPAKYRQNGAMGLGRVSTFDCISPMNFSDTILYAGNEPGNLSWAMHTCWLHYLYTQDDSMLLNDIYPVLKGSIQLYLNLMKKEEDGKYHLPISFSPEYKPAEDCSFDLTLFHWGLRTLISINNTFNLNDPMNQQWNETLKNLVWFHTDSSGLMVGKNVPFIEAHRHFSHLLGFYPVNIIDLSNKGNRDLCEHSLHHWLNAKEAGKWGGLAVWSHTMAAGMFARLENGNDALKQLHLALPGCTYNTMYREAGMCSETPYTFVKSLNEMLLQSDEHSIKVFPALPDTWKDASFQNLRAAGAFLVSSEMKNGKLQYVKIKSLAGKTLTIISKWKSPYIAGADSYKQRGDTLIIQLKKDSIAFITE